MKTDTNAMRAAAHDLNLAWSAEDNIDAADEIDRLRSEVARLTKARLITMKTKYRIVKDNWCGFEVQCKRWWWPFWIQCDCANTHLTIEGARAFAKSHSRRHVIEVID